MRILHTADWHLGDRLGRIDRTSDLRVAVERVGQICKDESVDVLLIAGDLFSELARPDVLRESIHHWQEVFRDFFNQGGTIVSLTGNHDNEIFCRTLTHAMDLAAPMSGAIGESLPLGRLYLATEPTLLRLPDRKSGTDVQFLLMPYPTLSRYFQQAEVPKYTGPEEKNARLMNAVLESMRRMQRHENYDAKLPTILGAHINVRGSVIGKTPFRMAEQDDVIFDPIHLPTEFTYVALGHIHKAQAISGRPNVRYSGSIEKMDLGEGSDLKGVVLLDVSAKGLVGEPRTIALPSTPIYDVLIHDPDTELQNLAQKYPNAENDLVNLHIRYTAGKQILEEILKTLQDYFPRWYARDWEETSQLGPSLLQNEEAGKTIGFGDTVREYIQAELQEHSESDRQEVLTRLETLFREVDT